MIRYLKADVTKLSYGEVWRWGSPLAFAGFVVKKLVGAPSYGPARIPDTPGITKLPAGGALPELAALLEPKLAALRGLGFDPLFHYRVETRGTPEGLAAAAIHSSGQAVALVTSSRAGSIVDTNIGIVSKTSKGSFLATGDARRTFDPPPEVNAMRLIGHPIEDIVAAHLKRLDA